MYSNRCKQFLLLPLFLLLVSPVFAARSLTVIGDKTALLGNEELTITASPSGFIDGETIYIKGAFFQSGSTNYFGYTKSGDSWIKNSTPNTSQRLVKIGEWDGTLVMKSDFSDSGYKGEGDYNVKVRFYYGSSEDWSSNVLAVNISEPDPTPTETPIPPTPTSVPATSTPVPPTATKAPTPFPTKTPTPTLRSSPTKTETPTREATNTGEVLSLSESASPTPTATPSASLQPFIITFSLIGAGLGILSLLFLWQKRNQFLRSKSPDDIIS